MDLGLHGCSTCYRPRSKFVPAQCTTPYLTEVIPTEVRNLLLEYALLAGGGSQPIKADYISMRAKPYDDWTSTDDDTFPGNATVVAYKTFCALSTTCHLLKVEANNVFWGKNRFSFHDVYGMRIFMDNLPRKQRDLIREIIFVNDSSNDYRDLAWVFGLLSQGSSKKITMGLPTAPRDVLMHWVEEVIYPTDLLVYVENGVVPDWSNLQVKIVHALDWTRKTLDWKPAPLVSAGSSWDARENRRLMDLASDILTRKTTIAALGFGDMTGIFLQGAQKEMMDIVRKDVAECGRDLLESSWKVHQRQRGWKHNVIAGSEWDRRGGATICDSCSRQSQEAQEKKTKKRTAQKKRRLARKAEKSKEESASGGTQPGRTMLGEVRNILRKPSEGGKGASNV